MVIPVVQPEHLLLAAAARRRQQRRAREDGLAWRDWLALHFRHYTTAPMAERHIRFWEWISGLRAGAQERPRVEVWPRGGGKSTTIELGCAFLGSSSRPRRHYVLYVSETQAQANKHVQAIATMLERVGVGRALNEYGAAKGWRHEEIRTANGFNVTAFGLDAGIRGVKLEEFRPDVIVMDDIDGRNDTEATREKKIRTITETILPAGAADCAVIVIQNKITEDSIVSQLADGRADFLLDRLPAQVEPAVVGLEYEREINEDGTLRYRITEGTPTWKARISRPVSASSMPGAGPRSCVRPSRRSTTKMAGSGTGSGTSIHSARPWCLISIGSWWRWIPILMVETRPASSWQGHPGMWEGNSSPRFTDTSSLTAPWTVDRRPGPRPPSRPITSMAPAHSWQKRITAA